MADKTTKYQRQNPKSLGSLLHYFTGMELTVEQKTGRLYTGTLTESDDAMNLTLDDATLATHRGSGVVGRPRQRGSASSPTTTESAITDTASTSLFAVLHIRGSTIRYIHFPERVDLSVVIKQGMDRERSASQRYKRGIRK
jgi:small nuclear ribonucleoprotein (snRNP)-like protein